MTARDLFKVNDRVQSRQMRPSLWSDDKIRHGVVRGFSRNSNCVRVQLDGRQVVASYDVRWWRLSEPRETAE